MSKLYRRMTNNIGTTSFSITMVTHYRPRSKFWANGILSWQIKSHDYKNTQNKTYRTFKGCVLIQHILQILRNLNMWLLKYDLWKRTAHSERNVNIQMHFATGQMITLLRCVVMTKNKQNLYFSDYYKIITHVQKHKMLNLSCIFFSYTY